MKRRIIINIEADELTDKQAIALVSKVIDSGKISTTAARKHYCHATITPGGIVIRATKRTDTTDTFTIYTR